MSVAESGHVWVNTMFLDSTLIPMMLVDIIDGENAREQDGITGIRMMKEGKPVPQSHCPAIIWGEPGSFKLQGKTKLPDLFSARGFWIVSERAAKIFASFNLGRGALYPVHVYDTDRKASFEGEHFCWIPGNTKSALSFEQSHGLRLPSDSTPEIGFRKPPFNLKDNDLSVTRMALGGPDVWLDPTLTHSLFLSGPLGDALARAKLTKAFRLYKARVVDDHQV